MGENKLHYRFSKNLADHYTTYEINVTKLDPQIKKCDQVFFFFFLVEKQSYTHKGKG